MEMVENHLDWQNKNPSPFISVYSDERRAEIEARRRVRDGHDDVFIWEIDTNEAKNVAQYRNLRRFAKKSGIWIPDFAWDNSEYEWLFLNQIPEAMIV